MDPNDLNRPLDPADPRGAVGSGGFEGPGFARMPSSSPPGPSLEPEIPTSPPSAPEANQFYGSPPDSTMRVRCPLCAEQVSAAAHICHFCGYSFDDGSTAEQRAFAQAKLNAMEAGRLVNKPRRGGLVVRLILSLLFLLFVLTMVGVILMNTFAQINHSLKPLVPTTPHPSSTAAKTLALVPPSVSLSEIES
jgi:hypothetical protein